MTALASLAVAVPLAAATVLAISSPLRWHRFASTVGIAATVAVGAICVALLLQVHDGRSVSWFGGWTPRTGTAVGVDFAVDGLAAGMAVLVCVLALAAQVVAARVIRVEDHLFDAVMLVFVAAALGMCFSGDLFNLYVWLELISVCGYVLVGYEVGQRRPLAGTLAFVVMGSVGGILTLFGIGLLYGHAGALNLAGIGRALEGGSFGVVVVAAYALVLSGLLVKTAAVPFHFWTADAYAVSPTPVALLLSGVYAELGLYAIARVQWTAFAPLLADHEALLRGLLVGLGVLTAMVGAVMCAGQRDLKRLLAFATIAQVGLLLIAVGLLDREALAGAAIWVVGDALAKAALFTVVGIAQHRHGTVDEEELWGRLRDAPVLAAIFGGAALCVASLPPFGPFLGKTLTEHAAIAGGHGWLVVVFVLTPVIVGGTLLRAWAGIFLGRGPRPERSGTFEDQQEDTEAEAGGLRVARAELLRVPAGLLALGAAVWGLVPGLRDAAGTAAARFVDPRGYAVDVLGGHAPDVAVAAPAPPDLTGYLLAVGTVLAAIAWAVVAVGRRSALHAPARGAYRALRRLHSGHVGDYVTWAVVGVVAIMAVLLAGAA